MPGELLCLLCRLGLGTIAILHLSSLGAGPWNFTAPCAIAAARGSVSSGNWL